jgi:hypothetical protein
MNLLIIGGLLAFGLLALLGSIFLARSEGQAAAKAATTPSPSATVKTTQPLKPLSDTPDTPAAEMPETEEMLPAVREEMPFVLNGQFHELANELHTLHEYAIELEQRLSVLTGIVDHVEQTQANHINIKEEAETPSLG